MEIIVSWSPSTSKYFYTNILIFIWNISAASINYINAGQEPLCQLLTSWHICHSMTCNDGASNTRAAVAAVISAPTRLITLNKVKLWDFESRKAWNRLWNQDSCSCYCSVRRIRGGKHISSLWELSTSTMVHISMWICAKDRDIAGIVLWGIIVIYIILIIW